MTVYGREDDDWDRLVEECRRFLVERARMRPQRLTSYTELNTVVANRTGLVEFDFAYERDRAAVGHLLGCVVDRTYDRDTAPFMLSALVQYLDENEPGPGFYQLAQQKGLWRRGESRDDFWISQLSAISAHYHR